MARKGVRNRNPRADLPTRPHSRESTGPDGQPTELYEPVHVLDVDAEPGTYQIDAVAMDIFGGGVDLSSVRSQVDIAGRHAHQWAEQLIRNPERHLRAKEFSAKLDQMVERCRAVVRESVDEIAGAFDYPSYEVPTDDPDDLRRGKVYFRDQAHAMDEVQRKAEDLISAVATFKATFPIGVSPSIGNSRPLERCFVEMMRMVWYSLKNEDAPTSKGGPFVKFVQAAWRDLEFDEPEGTADAIASYCDRVLRK